jgi:hypothetical protein
MHPMKAAFFFVTLAAVCAMGAAPADAASKHHRTKHTRSGYSAYATQPQIACTVAGCLRIPRGCHPEMGYTMDGTPTGYDVAVCGNYTLYGNRR